MSREKSRFPPFVRENPAPVDRSSRPHANKKKFKKKRSCSSLSNARQSVATLRCPSFSVTHGVRGRTPFGTVNNSDRKRLLRRFSAEGRRGSACRLAVTGLWSRPKDYGKRSGALFLIKQIIHYNVHVIIIIIIITIVAIVAYTTNTMSLYLRCGVREAENRDYSNPPDPFAGRYVPGP